jgi:hypothetical protein
MKTNKWIGIKMIWPLKHLWAISKMVGLLSLAYTNISAGCSPAITYPYKETRDKIELRIKQMMIEGDGIVWGKVDSIKIFESPKELYYDGYNVGDESNIIHMSNIINRRNPYLNIFQKYYIWFVTVKLKEFVFKIQIPQTNSECGYEYMVIPGFNVPFVKSKTGELKLVNDFYEYLGYRLVPGKDIVGMIGMEINWPNAPKLEK